MRKYYFLYLPILLLFPLSSIAQDDLLDMFADEETTEYATATFKATRVVMGQSVENPKNGNLNFLIQHQFGPMSSGSYEMWGLDQATIRLGFEYGINDWISIGAGRATFNKTWDGSTKLRLIRQSSGKKNFPLTISYFGAAYYNSLKWEIPERDNKESSRFNYVHQILIARKISDRISLQLSPTVVHRNLVSVKEDDNDVFLIAPSGRFKITNRFSINAEYFYILPGFTADNFQPAFNLGVDIETGGHVFQLYVTNANSMQEPYYMTQTLGEWGKGDLHLAFNLYRTFAIKKPKEFKKYE